MPAVLADIGGLFAIGFLLISFVGWVVNLINAQNPPPAPNRGPQVRPQARDRKVQNEIERFLQEAMGNKPAPRREETAGEEIAADEIEVLAPGPQRRPPQQPPAATPRPVAAPQVQAPKPPPKLQRPGSGVGSRHMMPSAELGVGVASHVHDHMREHVGLESNQHLPHSVNQGISDHLGTFTAALNDTRKDVKPHYRSRANTADPTGLIADLRRSEGMRKAILLQEILAKPRALRK